MPQIGEILKKGRNYYIWQACSGCGKERYVKYVKRNKTPSYSQCSCCGALSGEKSPLWKGGRKQDKRGYFYQKLQPDDFFYPMVHKQNYVCEHRLIMAQHLNRCLLPWEVVHHKNGIKSDNRLENLELLPDSRFHLVDQNSKAQIKFLQSKIGKLERMIVELREELEKAEQK